MSRLVLVLSLAAAIWGMTVDAQQTGPLRPLTTFDILQPLLRVQAFDCSRATCPQIRSCEEACYKLLVCGDTERDGDNDGIPCEELCSRRCPG